MKKTKVIALLAAVIATFSVWSLLSSRTDPEDKEAETVAVVTARIGIPEGTVIEAGMLELKKIPLPYVAGGVSNRIDEVAGSVARDEIYAGEQITGSRISSKDSDGAGLAYRLETGKRALTLEVGIEAGVAGLIAPGNLVDILVSSPAQDGSVETGYLLQKVKVMAVDSSMGKWNSDGQALYGSVTLSVTPEEAVIAEQKIFTARNVNGGNVRLTLRPQEDDSVSTVERAAGTSVMPTAGEADQAATEGQEQER